MCALQNTSITGRRNAVSSPDIVGRSYHVWRRAPLKREQVSDKCKSEKSRRESSLLDEARIHPVGQIQRAAAAGIGDNQVDEAAALGDLYVESPRLLAQAHDRALG